MGAAVRVLKKFIADTKSDGAHAAKEIDRLEDVVLQLQEEVAVWEERHAACNTHLETVQAELRRLQGEYEALQEQQRKILEQQGEARSHLRSAWSQVEELELLVPQLAAVEGGNAEEDLPQLSAEIAERMCAIKAFIADAKAEIKRLEETVKERAAVLMAQQNELLRMQQELCALTAERDALFKEKQAIEQYHQWKIEHKAFGGLRSKLGKKKDDSYRPWHRFMEEPAASSVTRKMSPREGGDDPTPSAPHDPPNPKGRPSI